MWALNSIKRLRGRGNSSIELLELLEESLQSRNTGYCYSIETDQTNTRLTNHVCVQTPVLTQSTNLAQHLPCNVWQVWQQSLSHFMTKGYRRNFLLSWCTSCRNYFSCCLTPASALMHTEKQPSVSPAPNQTKVHMQLCGSKSKKKFWHFCCAKWCNKKRKQEKQTHQLFSESCLCKWYPTQSCLNLTFIHSCVRPGNGFIPKMCHSGRRAGCILSSRMSKINSTKQEKHKMYIFMSHKSLFFGLF